MVINRCFLGKKHSYIHSSTDICTLYCFLSIGVMHQDTAKHYMKFEVLKYDANTT